MVGRVPVRGGVVHSVAGLKCVVFIIYKYLYSILGAVMGCIVYYLYNCVCRSDC